MATNVYDIGDRIRISVTFTVDGVASDPSEVTLKVQDPSGNEAEYVYSEGDLTRDDTGVYYYDVTVDESGYWYYRMEATGDVVASGESHLAVRKSEF